MVDLVGVIGFAVALGVALGVAWWLYDQLNGRDRTDDPNDGTEGGQS